ncbi:unnamed protein product [marine sediment metagenome]|uniref:Uncharacterized protein n=1 Tax=marine sediment metagenome TaxID=412755 RepID=X0ZG12_9ZZZZ
MRDFHAFTLESWPRRKRGDLIFRSTEEAFYYAHILDDTQPAYDLLKKWRANTYHEIKAVKKRNPLNFDRLFDLAVRAQFYREAMEEITRINKGEL